MWVCCAIGWVGRDGQFPAATRLVNLNALTCLIKTILFSLAGATCLSMSLKAADWPQFLGPQRNGTSLEKEEPPEEWTGGLPKVLWEKKLGHGFAGPAVVQGRVIVFHREDDEAVVEALDATSGKVLWRTPFATSYRDSFGFDDGPRAVPTVNRDRIFVHGADGRVCALDFASGKLLWTVDTVAEFASPQGYFGRACAPLVLGDLVIITPGGTKNGQPAGVVALGASDGAAKWQAVDDESGYASPMIVKTAEDHSLMACWMRNEVHLLDVPRNGGAPREVFHERLRSSMDASVNAATPILCGDGRLFISAGYGVGATLWDTGKWTPGKSLSGFRNVWQRENLMDCHYSTPVFFNGHLYGFHGRQETGQVLRCIDPDAGKVLWESPEIPGGTLLRVGGRLLVVTEQGELWLLQASPDKFDQLGSAQILRAGHRSYPAYADGVLYARDGEKLVAVQVR